MSDLSKLLEKFRYNSKTEIEKGKLFESLCKIFLENDSRFTDQFSKVWHYDQWAKETGLAPSKDIGVDLVSEIKGGGG